MLAHDLNNPLTWIYSGIEFALEALAKGNVEQVRTDLAQAREGADRLHAVVRRLEAYAASGDPGALRPPAPTVATDPTPTENLHASRVRVLVVDDEPALVELLEQVLGATHVVVASGSPRAALELVAAGEPFDAVLCDYAMPELDGLAFHAELLRVAPLLSTRCVLMTGGASTPRAHALLEAFPGPRLAKPFSLRALREVLRVVTGPFVEGAAAADTRIG